MYHRYMRDIGSEVSDVKNTFSGWDQCMAKAYCKWPVIIGIIVGAVIAISVIWCLVRCLCCGLECCCSCFSCFSCCTSCCSHSHHRQNGYSQPAPPQFAAPQYTQYQPAAAPVYRAQQQHQTPQYAHFDAPSGNKQFNEDALPAMPSWNTSRTLRQHEPSDMEMGSIQASAPMLPKSPSAQVNEYPYQANAGKYGDVAASHKDQYGYGGYSPRVASPVTAAPSYHSVAPGAAAAPARKPVGGSWRDV
ncbi:hypothetical protein E4T48_06971 [Aureobasidium sp. EXF-10727]|nr:hypothetical protein E4T48_06971 [Aureobasidium sp. EXF-10727]